MKKRLEADLISIAHRILQLKNKSDVNQLYLETQKLYEKLAVLRFVEEHFGDVKPTIGQAEIEQKIEEAFDTAKSLESNEKAEPIIEPMDAKPESPESEKEEATPLANETALEESETIAPEEEKVIEEPLTDSAVPEFKPSFELTSEAEIATPNKPEAVQISFEDLLGGNFTETTFVKVQPDDTAETSIPTETATEIDVQEKEPEPIGERESPKNISLNEKLSKGIQIDLNDRIAFVKHLFGNSNEDYNRVLNQLITLNTFQETKQFIDEMVKPDYNNWEGKEEYEQRFMEIIEKKFL